MGEVVAGPRNVRPYAVFATRADLVEVISFLEVRSIAADRVARNAYGIDAPDDWDRADAAYADYRAAVADMEYRQRHGIE